MSYFSSIFSNYLHYSVFSQSCLIVYTTLPLSNPVIYTTMSQSNPVIGATLSLSCQIIIITFHPLDNSRTQICHFIEPVLILTWLCVDSTSLVTTSMSCSSRWRRDIKQQHTRTVDRWRNTSSNNWSATSPQGNATRLDAGQTRFFIGCYCGVCLFSLLVPRL